MVMQLHFENEGFWYFSRESIIYHYLLLLEYVKHILSESFIRNVSTVCKYNN